MGRSRSPAMTPLTPRQPARRPPPVPPPPLLDLDAVIATAERFVGDSALEVFDFLPARDGDHPQWPEPDVYRALARVRREGREARQRQAKQALLAANGGTALGIEAQQAQSARYVLILADASRPGRYRYSAFDEQGFFTHSTHATAEAALEEAIRDGYTVPAPGALERLFATASWRCDRDAGRAAVHRAS